MKKQRQQGQQGQQRESWDGGWIHRQADGRPLYIIEKQRQGRRFHISTRCNSESAAYKHWERFQADPWEYEREMKEGREPEEGLFLTADLVLAFREWLLTRPEKPTTIQYAQKATRYLTDWIDDLEGRDLRKLELPLLKQKMNARPDRQGRTVAIKSFCSWLRKERHLLDRRDDVTLGLLIPQSSPEKHRRRKAVELERVRAVLPYLPDHARDMLVVAAGTGWHFRELQRFVQETESDIVDINRDGVLAVLVVRHKSGKWTRTPVLDEDVLAAARRLRAPGVAAKTTNAYQLLRDACDKAGVPRFTWGVMRHTVATWAVQMGALPEVVSQFLGHESKRTTERFYIDVAVPSAHVELPRLRLVK
jgi:integrase